jgi:hypothetical protein
VPELLTQPRAEYSNYVTGGLDQGFLRDLDVLLNSLIDRVPQSVFEMLVDTSIDRGVPASRRRHRPLFFLAATRFFACLLALLEFLVIAPGTLRGGKPARIQRNVTHVITLRRRSSTACS